MTVTTRRRLSRRSRQVERRNGHTPFWAYFALGLAGIFAVATIGAVAVASTIYSDYADDYRDPQEFIEELNPGGAKIFSADGTLLYQYKDPDAGLRNPVPLDAIPPSLIEATISTEDNSFYDNPGVNIEGLVRAAWDNTGLGNSPGFLEGSGGSSITQQLVKNLYFSERVPITETDPVTGEEVVTGYRLAFEDRSYERKLKEIVLALELNEKKSKDEILELYLNTIGYGNDAYGVPLVGVQAAAEGYFDKDVGELTLGEAALLAGLPQDPTSLNPIKHPDDARARQEDVLDLLVENNYITEAEAAAAFNESYTLLEGNSGNIVQRIAEVQLRPELDNSFHFVRSYLPDVIERMCKSGQLNLPEDIWDGNPDTLVETCDNEIVLRQLDEDVNGNGVLDAAEDLDEDGQIDPVEDTNANGVLDEGEDVNGNGVLDSEDANQNGVLDPAEDLNDDGELQQGGTFILGGLSITISLDAFLQGEAERIVREKAAEFDETYGANNAAMVAIEPATGRVLAYVGSRDFTLPEDSVGTRGYLIDPQTDVLQSHQSPGSAFKFFTYVTAFERGSAEYPNWSPGTSVYNAPLRIFQPGTECDDQPDTYCPRNANGSRGGGGQVTVREALRDSMNVPAVFTTYMVCPGQGAGMTNCPIVENAHRLGITDLVNGVVDGETGEVRVIQDIGCVYDLTLGGCEVRPFDMAYAASVFANNGVMAGVPSTFNWSRLDSVRPSDDTPYSTPAEWRRPLDPVGILRIDDADGNNLFEFTEPTRQQVMPPQYPFMVSDILTLPTGTLGFEIPGQEGAVYGKTGTAEERGDLAPGVDRGNTDTWVVGYSTQIAVAVWVGNTRNEPFSRDAGAFGANTAGVIFQDFMTVFHQGKANAPVARPEGLEEGPVGGGCDPVVTDLFVSGSQPLASETSVINEETGEETSEPEETEYCRVVEIDTRNDLLATDCVPEELIERRTFRNFPEGIIVEGVSNAEIPEETSDLCEEDGTIPPFILADPTGDFDQDDVINVFDNCPLVPNRNQRDSDDDGIGDECDSEDGDGNNPFPDDDDDEGPIIIDRDDNDNDGGGNPFPNP
jgi:membrane peptidoglycan carboxypeptidase